MAKLIPSEQLQPSNPNVTMTYTGSLLTGVVKTDNGVTISSKTLIYANGKLTQTVTIANGITTTKTLNYTGTTLNSITVS